VNQQQQMMRQLAQMQQAMAKAQEEIAATEVTASAGGGTVTVTATGNGELKGVKIDPAALDPDDVELLEDMILAAVNEARRSAEEVQKAKLGAVTGGLAGLPGLGGLGIPGL
jgi:DNA-binding YbaB/EbfC family protein